MLARIISATLTLVFGLASFIALSAEANAAWYEASSDNFVIYANDSEKDIRRYAENLERYHSAMEFLLGRTIEKPSPSNRVVIFVVGSNRKIRKIAGGDSRYVAGFYIPRAGASRAFVQTIRHKNGYPDLSTIVLLHEYAHHFMISTSRFEMPLWLAEGSAEFFAAAGFNKDGSVLIGRPALHRGRELFYAQDVPIRELLDYELYTQNRGRGYDAFYGRSWLLYHYLTFTPERSGQLDSYWRAVATGEDSLEAAERVFGDLDQLETDLSVYVSRKGGWMSYRLTPEKLSASPVSLRRLPKGEAATMDVRIRSQRGVNAEQAAELVEDARAIAQEYPDDPGVLTALAEAEFDAGNDDAAIAAADRAIALDPTRANAYVQKGYALFRKARGAPVPDQAYRAAMKPFQALNTIENDHPMPLIYYYRSYAERGMEPPENAKHALERAAQLAPFDQELWFQVAIMQMQEGNVEAAKQSLKPIANNPHGGMRADKIKQLIAALETMPDGEPVDMRMAIGESDEADSTSVTSPETNDPDGTE